MIDEDTKIKEGASLLLLVLLFHWPSQLVNAAETLRVFYEDRQCFDSNGLHPDQVAKELEKAGIKNKMQIPKVAAPVCEMCYPKCSLYYWYEIELDKENAKKAQEVIDRMEKRFRDEVWIVKPSDEGSCGYPYHGGVPLKTQQDELEKAGIIFKEVRQALDGEPHCKACGCSTGALHAFRINKIQLETAKALGFQDPPPKMRFWP